MLWSFFIAVTSYLHLLFSVLTNTKKYHAAATKEATEERSLNIKGTILCPGSNMLQNTGLKTQIKQLLSTRSLLSADWWRYICQNWEEKGKSSQSGALGWTCTHLKQPATDALMASLMGSEDLHRGKWVSERERERERHSGTRVREKGGRGDRKRESLWNIHCGLLDALPPPAWHPNAWQGLQLTPKYKMCAHKWEPCTHMNSVITYSCQP